MDLMDGGCVRLLKGDFDARGGLRDLAQIQNLLKGGVDRVVIGSLAVTNPQMVKHWIKDVGPNAICVALDVNQGEDGEFRPATKGWTEPSKKTL